MPVVRDASGNSVYVSAPKIDVSEPEKLFDKESKEYEVRLAEARFRIIEAIRYDQRPLYGRGFNNEVESLGPDFAELAKYVDLIDGKRANRLKKQRIRERKYGLGPNERRLRSPQDLKRRRSAIFSGGDFPPGFFKGIIINQIEFDELVEQVRLSIIEAAIMQMWNEFELEYLNDTWYVKIFALDQHIADRKRGNRRSHQVKTDDRSFHGRPNRDR
jgi:hypothetical protein